MTILAWTLNQASDFALSLWQYANQSRVNRMGLPACHIVTKEFLFTGLWGTLHRTAYSFVVVEIKNQQQNLLLIKLRLARN